MPAHLPSRRRSLQGGFAIVPPILATVLLIWVPLAGQCPAQESYDEDALTTRVQALEEKAKATGGEADPALAVYRDALAALTAGKVAAAKADEYRQKIAGAQKELAAIEQERPREFPAPPADGPKTPLDDLLARFQQIKVTRDVLARESEELATEELDRTARRSQLSALLTQTKSDLATIDVGPSPPLTGSDIDHARHALKLNLQRALEKEVDLLTTERAHLQETAELFSARMALNQRHLAAANDAFGKWQKAVDLRRGSSAEQQAVAARKLQADLGDEVLLKDLAKEMVEFADERSDVKPADGAAVTGIEVVGLVELIAQSTARLARVKDELRVSEENHLAAHRRVTLLEGAGLSIDQETGELMRRQRYELRPVRELTNRLRQLVRESTGAQISQQERERTRKNEPDVETHLGELLAADPALKEKEQEVRDLLTLRLQLLDGLIKDYRTYNANLTEITDTYRNLTRETASYSRFIDERLLWIRSASVVSVSDLVAEKDGMVRLLGPAALGVWRDGMLLDIHGRWLLWLLLLVLLAFLLIRRRHLKVQLARAGKIARARRCVTFAPTAEAVICSALLALPLPLLFWFLYWRSAGVPPEIATGLRNVAAFLSSMSALWVATRKDGLLVNHFGVAPQPVAVLHRNLYWFATLFPLCLFFATALPLGNRGSVDGRLFFIAGMIIVMVMVAKVLKPEVKLVRWHGRASSRFAKFWHAFGILAPLALAVGAALGWFASVRELRVHLVASLAVALLTVFAAALIHRWILVGRRKLALQRDAQRRVEAAARREKEKQAAEAGEDGVSMKPLPPEVIEDEVDEVVVEEQTTRLTRAAAIAVILVGLWGIWSQNIPALSAFDRITLWSESGGPQIESGLDVGMLTGESKDSADLTGSDASEDGPVSDRSVASDSRVTLEDLITSIAILVLTLVAARNIPGLLELTIFRRLNLQAGTAFAYTTTIRYFILLIGIMLAFGTIGITWSKVQWIAAAITLGIGFGLQEVFANFVAGLIILFERPIRFGDFVTIGNLSGQVTQIRIRATTIRDFSNKELVVPNKEFITKELLNWTLSDSVIRMEIPVGIAYGSDTEKAREILLQVASEDPAILESPAPGALFQGFGDSSLNFELRVYIRGVEEHLRVRSGLHFAIDREFRKAGIEIAFPQSDVHIRSLPERGMQNMADELNSVSE